MIEQDTSLPYGNGSPIVSAKDFVKDDEAFVNEIIARINEIEEDSATEPTDSTAILP